MDTRKIFAMLLLGYSTLHISSATGACSLTQYEADVQPLRHIAAPTVTSTICGQTVTITSLTGVNLNSLASGVGGFLGISQTLYNGQNIQLTAPVQIAVNGQVVITTSLLTPSLFTGFLQALGVSVALPALSASSMASTSPSARVNDIVYSRVINPSLLTRSQLKHKQNTGEQHLKVFLADVKYERGYFSQSKDNGNIGGFTAGASFDLDNNVTIGAIVPYDYLDFSIFNASRTGVIFYAKKLWNLPGNFELSTALNSNYMFTASKYALTSDQISTVGGGFSTRFMYDAGGDFITGSTFSFQFNQDDRNYIGNHQYLVKIGPTLGYRVADNAVVQVSGDWNKNLAWMPTGVDTEFYTAGIEGTWFISDMWQLKGGYKKLTGYKYYESDSVYLGSSVKF